MALTDGWEQISIEAFLKGICESTGDEEERQAEKAAAAKAGMMQNLSIAESTSKWQYFK